MTIPILCLVSLCFIFWVYILKTENEELKEEIEKLRGKKKAVEAMGEIEVGKDALKWGGS